MSASFPSLSSLSDIQQLPSVAIHELGSLPTGMAIYFVVSNSSVLYIGSTAHLWLRWYKAHHKFKQIQAEEGVRLYWLSVEMEINALAKLEMQFINHFNPVFNTLKVTNPDFPVASGKSAPPPIQLSLASASTDQPSVLAKYFHKVRTYSSHGKLYYRYTCNVGHEVTHDEHIPGGNVRSAVAKNRATQVRRWIRDGVAPDTIVQRIRKWRAPKRR